jgi:isopenicillin N synthase-like dioxygenase
MVPEWVNSKNAPGSTNGIHTNGHSFPDDVPTAPLLTLSFDKLAARDPEETPRLLAASLDTGFFYLDLRNSEDGESILEIADKLFNLAKEIFNIPAQEKEQAETGRGFVATRSVVCGSHT